MAQLFVYLKFDYFILLDTYSHSLLLIDLWIQFATFLASQSSSTHFNHVSLGLPRLLRALLGVPKRILFGYHSSFALRTCPAHLSLLSATISSIGLAPVALNKFLFEISLLFLPINRLNLSVWNALSFEVHLRSHTHVSAPYNNTLKIEVL